MLAIPVAFSRLHDEELVDYTEAALATSFFEVWGAAPRSVLGFGECAGYRTPLFLGGRDDVQNLEPSDVDVYWTIVRRLLRPEASA